MSICIAHIVRIFRWELFIKVYEKPNKRNLMQALSCGFMLNYILPFKLGEIIRAWIAGRKMKNGKALAFSTVIVDRYLDIISVGIIFVFLSSFGVGGKATKQTAVIYIAASVVLLVMAIVVYTTRNFIKKVIRLVAGIFNSNIESAILQFAWALILNFKDIFRRISKIKLILTTVVMWLAYLVSYYLFTAFLQSTGAKISWIDLFYLLFAQNGLTGSTGSLTLYAGRYMLEMFVYMVLPVILIFVIAFAVKKEVSVSENDDYLRLLPHMDPEERLNFLEGYFSNKNKSYLTNYLKINQDVSIIRDYSAGSNATTMLCMDGKSTFFRKYAFGEEGEKLYQQILWIEQNRNGLMLPEVLRKEKTEVYCFYDMPYSSNSVGLFEYVHSMPVKSGWLMIKKVLESLEKSIYQTNVREADAETIERYIDTKVFKNLEKIKSAKRIKTLQQYKTIFINGVEYRNLCFYEKYLNKNYLKTIFEKDNYAVIHGDLTIENIICTRDEKGIDDFYIIDPNTGNVHDSPNLDYGKLLQSIHGGYEFLMSTNEVDIEDNRISFLFTRSSAYIELHKCLREYMNETLGEERTRSIYFHEIIHWLRLMPYKIEKDGKRALLFYAGMLMVFNDVFDMYVDI